MAVRPYLRSAPVDLVTAHRERKIGKGYPQLELLVTHPEMELAWQELSTRAKPDDKAWGMRFFQKIVAILHDVRRTAVTRRRSEDRDRLRHVAQKATELADMLENGTLDMLAYEYFPAEVMQINGFTEWATQNAMSRSALAYDVLRVWPSFPEMLRELAAQAEKQANEAMSRPRVVDRHLGTESYRQLYVVRALSAYMTEEFGSPLYGTVARIASALLDTGFTKEEIEKMARGGPSKP